MGESVSAPLGFDINSVLIYLIFFGMSFGFVYGAERCFRKRKHRQGVVLIAIGIIVLCILAALRSTDVGGDISVYILPNFKIAKQYDSFFDFYNYSSNTMELLFSALLYLFARINSLSMLFFSIELLALIPIVYVLYKNINRCSITIGYIIYVFLFYNFSLSGMRQSIAMSFVLLAVYHFENHNLKQWILWGTVAVLFHTGSIIPLIVTFLMLHFENRRVYKKIIAGTILILIGFIVFYNQLSNILYNVFWIINPRYSYYIRTYMSKVFMWENIPSTEIVFKLGITVLCMLFGKYKKSDDKSNLSILAFSIIGRLIVVLNARMYEALRMAYYFDIFTPLLTAQTVRQIKGKNNRIIIGLFIVGLAFLYWIYFIMYIGGYHTNVYTFA